MAKDDITLMHEAEAGETKEESAVRRLDPLIEQYQRDCGGSGEPLQTVLTDLLADLMHWAAAQHDEEAEEHDEEQVDFAAALSSAEYHFGLEHDDEDDDEDEASETVCRTCHRPLHTDCGVWVDDTGGDVCMDNDGKDGAHKPASDDED